MIFMRICIFGSGGTNINNHYIEETEKLGRMFAERGHGLMFGGGKNGLMGAAARGFKAAGGHIIGVAPHLFDNAGVIFDGCDEFVSHDTMRDRKKYMEDNSDAFIVTPGGTGTYEEFFEVLTLKQLAQMSKPIIIFNIDGYYDKMLELLKENVKDGFVRPQTLELFKVSDDIDEVIFLAENDTYDIEKIKFAD